MHVKSSPMAPRTIRRSLGKSEITLVTGKAILHPHRGTSSCIDFFCTAVASFATDPRFRMQPVRKNDIRRQKACKGKRHLRRNEKRLVKFFDFCRFRQRQIVTIHAVRFRGHLGVNSDFCTHMAFGAIQPQRIRMLFVVKRDSGRIFIHIFRKRCQIPYDKTCPA